VGLTDRLTRLESLLGVAPCPVCGARCSGQTSITTRDPDEPPAPPCPACGAETVVFTLDIVGDRDRDWLSHD
jgi:hypothetical protein